jgi:hypothetical protein
MISQVRNTVTSSAVNLTWTQNVPVSGLQVPALLTSSISMTFQFSYGLYNLYAASTTLNIYQLANTNVKFDVSVGSGSSLVADSFKNTNQLPTACSALGSVSSTSTTSTTSTSIPATSTTSTSISSTSSTSTSATSAAPTESLIVPNGATLPRGWSSYGCYLYVLCHPPYHNTQEF